MFKRNIFVLGTIILVMLSFTSCESDLLSGPDISNGFVKFYDKIQSVKFVDFSIEKIEPNDEFVIEEVKLVEDIIKEELTEDPIEEELAEELAEELKEDTIEKEQVEEIIQLEQVENVVDEIEFTTNTTEEIKVETLVQNTTTVDNSYLEDALFIGDSILKGFKLFVSPYPDNVLAEQNVGLDQIYNNREIYYTSATEKDTLWNTIDTYLPNPEKIYTLIGVNGIPGLENDQSMKYYEDLIIKLKQKFPDKPIYACAVTPLTKELSEKRAPSFSTEKIDDFNNQLRTLCQKYNIYFLQTDENLKDSDGYLISKYDAGDGMHLNRDGHNVLLEYFKSNVAYN